MFWLYAGFLALILIFVALDLGVFNRKAHVVGVREAVAHWAGLYPHPRDVDSTIAKLPGMEWFNLLTKATTASIERVGHVARP